MKYRNSRQKKIEFQHIQYFIIMEIVLYLPFIISKLFRKIVYKLSDEI
jgi:hypothetical protein